MEPEAILTTAIEVAIGIAGFSAIVVAIGPRSGSEWPEAARVALSALLLMSISTVVFGFVPLLLLSAAVLEGTVWPLSSRMHSLYLIAVATYRLRQTSRLPRGEVRRGSLIAIFGIFVLTVSIQAMNALWLQLPWPYLTSIVLMVIGAFTLFAVLLWQLWTAA